MLQVVYTLNLLVLRIELWKRLRVEGFYAPMEMGRTWNNLEAEL